MKSPGPRERREVTEARAVRVVEIVVRIVAICLDWLVCSLTRELISQQIEGVSGSPGVQVQPSRGDEQFERHPGR